MSDMICILGPTAVGKTRVAALLAYKIGGEIISADSRQVYRRMDIGTGKDLADYTVAGTSIPYHLIDIVEPGTEFNVYEYQRLFLSAYNLIKENNHFPIMCGGTGMYIDAVVNGYQLRAVEENIELRKELAFKTDDELKKLLISLRPLHNSTDTVERSRMIRAIEIAVADKEQGEKTVKPFPGFDVKIFGLRMDRMMLKKRIDTRLKVRLKNGMIEEVEALLDSGLTAEQLEFYGLEYRLVTKFVVGGLNYNDMYQKLREAIYQFARRQEKWYRRMERKGTVINWLDAGVYSADELVEKIIEYYSSALSE